MLVGAFLPEPDDTFGNAEQLLAELVKRSSRYAFQVGHTLHAEERFALAFVATDARRLDCLISSDVPTPTRAGVAPRRFVWIWG